MKKLYLLFFLVGLSIMLIACSTSDESKEGVLQFTANGEDFIREGFVTKDGWEISFDHAYIHLANIRAYQTDPPYDPDTKQEISGDIVAALPGEYTIDLAAGDEEAELLFVDSITAPVGHYNALSWEIRKASEGPIEGHMLQLIGTAQKDGHALAFTLSFDKSYQFSAGEFIGDDRKGFVTESEPGELEMTFHFDHLFGDAELPQEDELNVEALGFQPFADLANDGQISLNQTQMLQLLDAEVYSKLLMILPSLGHVGEGHAYSIELE